MDECGTVAGAVFCKVDGFSTISYFLNDIFNFDKISNLLIYSSIKVLRCNSDNG